MYNIGSAQRNIKASLIVNKNNVCYIGYVSNVIYIMYINISSNNGYVMYISNVAYINISSSQAYGSNQ